MGDEQKKFRFLCIPGAMTNAKTFHVQLEPFMKAVQAVNPAADFYLTQGNIPVKPMEGFENYFGNPPLLRFLAFDGLENMDMMERLRDFPEERTAEATMRKLLPSGLGPVRKSLVNALEALYQTMEEHGPFDGVLGYSEGATVAATLLLDEQQRCKAAGTEPSLKCAVFFAGWPPLMVDRDTLVLGDTDEEVIDVPTLHIIGSNDPYLAGVMCLYNVCDSDSRMLFDHGQGHIIVRDEQTLVKLAVKVQKLIKKASD